MSLPADILDIIIQHTDTRIEIVCKAFRDSSRRRKRIDNIQPIPWSSLKLYKSIELVSGSIHLELNDDLSTIKLSEYRFVGSFAGFIRTVCKYDDKRVTLHFDNAIFECQNKVLKMSGKPSIYWSRIAHALSDLIKGLTIHVDIGNYDYYYLTQCVPSNVNYITLTADKHFQPDTLNFMDLYTDECKHVSIRRLADCMYTKDDLKGLTDIPITWID